jgi:glycosyltransferase involved in cell wall biosynthesis
MLQVEAGACEKPVIGTRAMGMLDTLVHERTALLARVAETITVNEVVVEEAGSGNLKTLKFSTPRIVDYRAEVEDIRAGLLRLMTEPGYREKLGKAARQRVVEQFDYRRVAERFVQIITGKLCIH